MLLNEFKGNQKRMYISRVIMNIITVRQRGRYIHISNCLAVWSLIGLYVSFPSLRDNQFITGQE